MASGTTSHGSGRHWPHRLANVLVTLAVIAVAGAAFVFSYGGVHSIALLGGVSAQLARYYPGLFDAVLVIACVAAVLLRDGRWWPRLWAWLVIVVVLAAIGTADVLHAMNYTLRHRPTEGIVAAAPVAAVLLAFSLLVTLLRQSRAHHALAPVTATSDVPALSPGAADAPIALTAAPTVSVPVPALAGPVPVTVTAVEAAPPTVAAPVASTRVRLVPPPEAATVFDSAPQDAPAADETLPAALLEGELTRDNAAEQEQSPEYGPTQGTAALEGDTPGEIAAAAAPSMDAAALSGEADEPAPPTVAVPAVTPLPVPSSKPQSHGIRYADGSRARQPRVNYWDTEDTEPFVGLVYRASDDAGTRDDTDDTPGGSAAQPTSPELNDDAPSFATAPFASVPRLRRVRSTPTPPADEDA